MQRTRRSTRVAGGGAGGGGGDDMVGDVRNAPFLVKLFHMLGDPSLSPFIRWSEDGLSIVIVNVRLFTQEKLPTYFKTGNYQSFVRQLHLYGMRKRGEDSGGSQVFFHPDYHRDMPLEHVTLLKRRIGVGYNRTYQQAADAAQTQAERYRSMTERVQASTPRGTRSSPASGAPTPHSVTRAVREALQQVHGMAGGGGGGGGEFDGLEEEVMDDDASDEEGDDGLGSGGPTEEHDAAEAGGVGGSGGAGGGGGGGGFTGLLLAAEHDNLAGEDAGDGRGDGARAYLAADRPGRAAGGPIEVPARVIEFPGGGGGVRGVWDGVQAVAADVDVGVGAEEVAEPLVVKRGVGRPRKVQPGATARPHAITASQPNWRRRVARDAADVDGEGEGEEGDKGGAHLLGAATSHRGFPPAASAAAAAAVVGRKRRRSIAAEVDDGHLALLADEAEAEEQDMAGFGHLPSGGSSSSRASARRRLPSAVSSESGDCGGAGDGGAGERERAAGGHAVAFVQHMPMLPHGFYPTPAMAYGGMPMEMQWATPATGMNPAMLPAGYVFAPGGGGGGLHLPHPYGLLPSHGGVLVHPGVHAGMVQGSSPVHPRRHLPQLPALQPSPLPTARSSDGSGVPHSARLHPAAPAGPAPAPAAGPTPAIAAVTTQSSTPAVGHGAHRPPPVTVPAAHAPAPAPAARVAPAPPPAATASAPAGAPAGAGAGPAPEGVMAELRALMTRQGDMLARVSSLESRNESMARDMSLLYADVFRMQEQQQAVAAILRKALMSGVSSIVHGGRRGEQGVYAITAGAADGGAGGGGSGVPARLTDSGAALGALDGGAGPVTRRTQRLAAASGDGVGGSTALAAGSASLAVSGKPAARTAVRSAEGSADDGSKPGSAERPAVSSAPASGGGVNAPLPAPGAATAAAMAVEP